MIRLKQPVLYTVATLCTKLSGVAGKMRGLLALFLVATARAMPAFDQDAKEQGLMTSVMGVVKECAENDVSLCLKVRRSV